MDPRMMSDQAKGNFLAVMSHEIRTPLNGILGFADFMAIHPDLPDSLKEHVHTIQKSGRDLLRVVNDILNYGRLEEGSIQLERAEFSPRKVLQDVCDLLLPAAKTKGLELRLEASETLPATLLGDRTWLAQILLNIGGNAVKFTEKGGVVLGCSAGESLEAGKARLDFFVKDTGIGIPPDRINQIFEPFEQADVSTSRNYGGTGLGLAISRSLLELMEGEIGVESAVGVGTTFRFSINFDVPAAPEAAPEKEARPAGPLGILIAEDNAINRRVIEKLLAGFGYAPVSVGDGASAVDAFAVHRPRCVIMDLHMPELDGIQATQRIRAFEREHGLRPSFIIALTADVMPEEQQRCLDAGMNLYLTKPIRPEDLEAAMKRAAAAWSGPG